MNLGNLKTSLALRSVVFILLISGLVGLLFLLVGRNLVAEHEQSRFQEQLDQLLNTIQNPASIAIFLSDKQLATEVAAGLVQNDSVWAVTIQTADDVLAHLPAGEALPAEAANIVRKVTSPFEQNEVIGEITLYPDNIAMKSEINTNIYYVTLFFIGQLLAVALSILAVVIHSVTRPIEQISHRLHTLKVEAGEKLAFPSGSEDDEIGTLVKDVNALIDNLISLLTNERQLRSDLETEEKRFRAIVENAETGIFLMGEDQTLLSANPAFCHFFSITARDIDDQRVRFSDILGESIDSVQHLIKHCMETGESATADIRREGLGGERWFNLIISTIGTNMFQGVANDITDRKAVEVAAEQQAVTDALTGISNRLGFEHQFKWLMDTCLRFPEHRFALLMIDLDRFKEANDTYGHLAGDKVLVAVAERLTKAIRRTDFAARLGGDEFAVVLHSTDDPKIIEKLASKIIDSLGQPIPIDDGLSAQIGASIGIVVHKDGELSMSGLMAKADEAMYAAKKAGRNTFRFWSQQPE